MSIFRKIIKWFSAKTLFFKVVSLIILFSLGWFVYTKTSTSKSSAPQYQTSTVQKGTLISSVSASGNITSSNNISITTQTSGSVSKVYVKNGDTVKEGQKLADIAPDQDAQQKQAAAWASYLNAKNSVTSSSQSKLSAQAQLESARKSVLDAQSAVDVLNNNLANGTNNPATKQPYTELEKLSIQSTLTNARENFTALEAKYNSSDASITSAQAGVNSAWLNYQQTSSTITAPASGVINNFALIPGASIANLSTSSSSNTSTAQSVGAISQPQGTIIALVNLTEMDVISVKTGQKVTLTLDAFPDKTFTGKILAVNTNGIISSGVTSYPTTIVFDTAADNIYPNMAVNAKIITSVVDDALIVPSAAVQTNNGQSYVRVLKDGKVTQSAVEIGASSDTETQITSGVNEGDTIVTNTLSTSSSTGNNSQTRSVFSNFGGGNVRIGR